MVYLKPLGSVTQHELQAVGQRAIDLALLSDRGVPTVPSFVILSTAYDEMVRVSNLKYKVDYILAHAQENVPSTLLNAYNGVRKAMLEAPLPTGMEVEVREAYERISVVPSVGDLKAQNARTPVRVILSTNRFDDPESNDTIIQNINDVAELLTAIREAWALAYHPTQLRARLVERYPENKLKVAIIVQTMERAHYTCHVYSSVPQDHTKTYVQAYAGYPDLREKVEKDYFAVGKRDNRIVLSQTGRQMQMLDRSEQRALVLQPLVSQELKPRDVQEIARLAGKCERVVGNPLKCFFIIGDDTHDLLWCNRLGFDVMLKDEDASVPAQAAVPTASHWSTASSAVAASPGASEFPPSVLPSVPLSEVPSPAAASAAPAPTADDFLQIVDESPAQQQAVQASIDAAAQAAAPTVNLRGDAADGVTGSGVAAKLLGASLRIVRQVAECRYRSAFGETPVEQDLAQIIARLNDSSVFSRPVDGALLLKADEAAKAAGQLTSLEYAKVIEEVAYLMGYA
jgi:phosphoenolpyruvate synthase/pyruvate phosphate dikinase